MIALTMFKSFFFFALVPVATKAIKTIVAIFAVIGGEKNPILEKLFNRFESTGILALT